MHKTIKVEYVVELDLTESELDYLFSLYKCFYLPASRSDLFEYLARVTIQGANPDILGLNSRGLSSYVSMQGFKEL